MFKRANLYDDTLNSYDILKLVALAAMVLDHMGAYFWPQLEWLRAVGRLAFPFFLFLVGYSGVWKISCELVVCALLIILCAIVTHHSVFPLNILVTIIITRLAMDWLIRKEMLPQRFAFVSFACVVWFPLMLWFDYSTLAIVFALAGYLQRQHTHSTQKSIFIYAVVLLYFVIECVIFRFHFASLCILAFEAIIMAYLMIHFYVHTRSESASVPATHILQWIARNTLPLYTIHVVLFMILERVWFPERLDQFRWL